MMTTRIFIFFLIFIALIPSNGQTSEVKIMSYNIRCGYCEAPESENHWSKRKFLIATLIQNNQPDLIGLQEAELFQVADLLQLFPAYNMVGVGREDGIQKGETTAILYRKDRFGLQSYQTRWLSETPHLATKGWDAAYSRTLTETKFLDVKSLKTFYFFNTHFDHLGVKAQMESSKLLVKIMEQLDPSIPILLTGDFNIKNDTEGYKILHSKLLDAENIAVEKQENISYTFNNFGTSIDKSMKIDFVFVRGIYQVKSYFIDSSMWNGHYPSDHFPVIVTAVF